MNSEFELLLFMDQFFSAFIAVVASAATAIICECYDDI